MTSDDVDVAAGVTAALVCAGVGFLAELVLDVWAYRKPGFKSLRVRVWEWKMEVGERLKERRRSRFFRPRALLLSSSKPLPRAPLTIVFSLYRAPLRSTIFSLTT